MKFLKRILFYLNPLSRDENAKGNFNLRAMHGINRISIYLFIFAVVIMVIRAFS